jgi:hypothetical protein
MLTSPDSTYVISGAMYWSVIETNVGILAASIPSFKAIASRFLPRIIGEYTDQKKYGPWSNSEEQGRRYGYGTNFSKVRDPHAITLATMIGDDQAYQSNSSEERIIIPEGKILAQTHITTNVEIQRDHSDSLSFGHGRRPS